jgi:hypothetical protein
MGKSNVVQIAEILTDVIKKRVQTQFGLTSEASGAKLQELKKKQVLKMPSDLMKQILSLETKSMQDLREIYTKLYYKKTDSTSKQKLIRDISYRLQELEYGFLSEKHAKRLDSLADDMAKGRSLKEISPAKPINGLRICKEYHGVLYEVETVEDGFICNGLRYKSLSALASKITGNSTNGPKFFGLRKK